MNKQDYYFEPNIYDIVRTNIRKYRNIKGLTTTKLAEIIGIEPGTLRQIESLSPKTQTGFSFDTLYRISVALEISLDKFIEKE